MPLQCPYFFSIEFIMNRALHQIQRHATQKDPCPSYTVLPAKCHNQTVAMVACSVCAVWVGACEKHTMSSVLHAKSRQYHLALVIYHIPGNSMLDCSTCHSVGSVPWQHVYQHRHALLPNQVHAAFTVCCSNDRITGFSRQLPQGILNKCRWCSHDLFLEQLCKQKVRSNPNIMFDPTKFFAKQWILRAPNTSLTLWSLRKLRGFYNSIWFFRMQRPKSCR